MKADSHINIMPGLLYSEFGLHQRTDVSTLYRIDIDQGADIIYINESPVLGHGVDSRSCLFNDRVEKFSLLILQLHLGLLLEIVYAVLHVSQLLLLVGLHQVSEILAILNILVKLVVVLNLHQLQDIGQRLTVCIVLFH